jgi:hypothetical protein
VRNERRVIGPYYLGDETAAVIAWLAAAGVAYEQAHDQTVVVGNAKPACHEGVTVVRFPAGTVGKLRKAGFRPQVARVNDRHSSAIHEAGHAVIGRVLLLRCGEATIKLNPEAGEAGYAITHDPWATVQAWDDCGIYRRAMHASAIKGRILAFMAGRAAEEECIGHCRGGDGDDRHQIDLMLDSRSPADADIARIERRLRSMARQLVRRHRIMIERVAAELLEHTAVDGERLDALVGRPLPPVIRPTFDNEC